MKKLRHEVLSKLPKVLQLVRNRVQMKAWKLGPVPTDLTTKPHIQHWPCEPSKTDKILTHIKIEIAGCRDGSAVKAALPEDQGSFPSTHMVTHSSVTPIQGI